MRHNAENRRPRYPAAARFSVKICNTVYAIEAAERDTSHTGACDFLTSAYLQGGLFMKRYRPFAVTVLLLVAGSTVAFAEKLYPEDYADVPTAARPAATRIKELSPGELQLIETPADHDQIVFSIAEVRPVDSIESADPPATPWLLVYADGRIHCTSLLSSKAPACDDTLTKAELTWLLHLAVNRAGILNRSTKQIEAAFEAEQKGSRPIPSKPNLQYHLAVSSGKNDLEVPQLAIISFPPRIKLGLQGFANLNKFARYLNARAMLGSPQERDLLLLELNKKVKADLPSAPKFTIEDLEQTYRTIPGALVARFVKIVEVEPNKFQRITGDVSQRQKSEAPTCQVVSGPYTKPWYKTK